MTKFEKLIEDLGKAEGLLDAGDGGAEEAEAAEAVEAAIDILHMINQWCDAYPEKIFRPVNWEDIHRALEHAGLSGTAVAADCMRFVVTRMKESIEERA